MSPARPTKGAPRPAAMRAKRKPRPEPVSAPYYHFRPVAYSAADARRMDQEERDGEMGMDADDYFGREA